ncbi:MAG: hypothetical protein GWM98_22040, partial [Nitrospinaceae bacterium]|nr:hypothetical protein [Nitrospinaceae bacterium]NIR56642.1 hypothetical protein [Nitrospinaceae bacterium]NIS87105.1 hypothetical protein [Nitrospinaceae bacterium]NIT83959.1 hypothetical protein [Nitrospinaceae bacterium]NIU46150.1 hypothetical protein [Nitrospinaceae bacterium]
DLLIHTGEFGDQRLLGNATDISEHIIIESNGTSGDFVNVRVKGGGLRDSLGDDSTSFLDYQVKKGSKIIIDGGEGNDLFDLTGFTEDEVLFEIDGGSGDDEILLAGAAATGVAGKFSTIRGGRGDDTIQGSGGNDIIIGGLGNDNIMAGDGDDLVFGDEGEIGTDSVRADVAPTDGADTIDGEDGEDILIGGGGSDTITGGATMGDDLLIGGGGVVFFEPGEL